MKSILLLATGMLIVTVVAPVRRVRAEGIDWQWTHDAHGSGSANVFDGGPVEFAEGHTFGPADPIMSYLAIDYTQLGSLGATAKASGFSQLSVPGTAERLSYSSRFTVAYDPSGFVGGDNTGGTAQGEMLSILEFVMPASVLDWDYSLRERESFPFSGSTNVVVENVTQSQVLLELSSETPLTFTTLEAHPGDVIRVTTQRVGMGSMGPGSGRNYQADFYTSFMVPEPGVVLLLVIGAWAVPRPRPIRSVPRK